MHLNRLALLAAALLALGGCAHVDKAYESTTDKNFHIHADVDNSDSNRAFIYVYDINAECKRDYLGAIELEENQHDVEYGLPVGKKLVLEIEFVMAGGNTVVRDSRQYPLQTRSGQDYYADVRYKSRMFKASMAEGRGANRHALEHATHKGCGVF
ncbi:MAG TPA: hypothetical protein VIU46_03200 [Gallionellaceae bacterium]